jgi:hypothetical protein
LLFESKVPLPDFVDRGIDHELQHERREDAADHRGGDALHHIRAGADRPHDGHQPHEHHGHGHEFRANAFHGAL